MKKILIVLAILLVVGGIIYAGYLLSAKKQGAAGNTITTTGSLPESTPIEPGGGAQAGGGNAEQNQSGVSFKALGDNQFAAFSVASDTSVVAVGLDGKIFKVSADGSASALNSSMLDNFVSAQFSSDAQKIVFAFGPSESRQFSVFDVPTKSWAPLANNTLSATWKPKSHVLGYATEKSGLKTVFSLDLDSPKAKPQQIFSLRMEDLTLGWISVDKISAEQPASGLVPKSIVVYDLKKKVFSSPATDVPGALLGWDSAASRALEFAGTQTARGGDFKIISAGGETINKFQFVTLPEKCLFAPESAPTSTTIATSTAKSKIPPAPVQIPEEKNIICAVPSDQEVLAKNTIPDAYYRHSFFTSDNIYKINLEDGGALTLLSADKKMDVQNPVLFGDKLFFLNRSDNKLYSLTIPK